MHKLTEIDLSELQLGEKLTIYRGSNAFLTGPGAAGYVGEATVAEVRKKSATLTIQKDPDRDYVYRLRFRDARICRVPNGEPTELYVHARSGRPTMTAYFTDAEYRLVRSFLAEEASLLGHQLHGRNARTALSALERMDFHDNLRMNGGRT